MFHFQRYIEAKQKFRAGLVVIDVLSKYVVVVPIKSKEPLQKMVRKPT